MCFRISQRHKLDGELIVGPSLAMSGFCYSIFRLDPYIGCEHSCTYCYTRFLPGSRPCPPVVRVNYPKLFQDSIERLQEAGAIIPPLRMSALTDPFQPIERKLNLSLKLLEVSKELRVPIIISTKSTLIIEPPWLNVLKELAGEGLAIVQISIAFLDDTVAKKLEPNAPLPSDRLKAAEKLNDEGIPVVLRLQPVVPYLNSSADFADKYSAVASTVGARHIIVEVLRIVSWRNLEPFKSVMREEDFRKLRDTSLWESFPKGSHKHPHKAWRFKTYRVIKDSITKNGLNFALCREGFYGLNRAPDCCGIYLLKNKVLRFTLYELLYGPKLGYKYLRSEDAERLPLPEMRRKLTEHFKLMVWLFHNKSLLGQLVSENY